MPPPVVQDRTVDVCNDKLILAPTNPPVKYANDTTYLSPHSQLLDNGLPPLPPPEPPDLMLHTAADPDPDIITVWCNRVSMPYCGADLLCNLDVYPPGLLFDPKSQLQYGNLNDFPSFGLKVISEDNMTSPTSRFGDIHSSLRQDAILPLYFIAMVDLQQLGPPSLADGGANVCLTNDPTLLVDVVDIVPVPLRMADRIQDFYVDVHTKGVHAHSPSQRNTTLPAFSDQPTRGRNHNVPEHILNNNH
jgi:hypothetical protein